MDDHQLQKELAELLDDPTTNTHAVRMNKLLDRCERYKIELDVLRSQVPLADALSLNHNAHPADLYQRYQNELQAVKEAHGQELLRMQQQIEAANKRTEEALCVHHIQQRLEQMARDNELLRSATLRLHKK